MGSFTVEATAVRTLQLEDVIVPDVDPIQLAGAIEGPDRWRWILGTQWEHGNFSTHVAINGTSSYRNYFRNRFVTQNPPKVDGYRTVDLTVNYTVPTRQGIFAGTRMTFGARNLFDEPFPFADTYIGPFDTTRVDPRGQVAFFEWRKVF
jgi:hypothetical protein